MRRGNHTLDQCHKKCKELNDCHHFNYYAARLASFCRLIFTKTVEAIARSEGHIAGSKLCSGTDIDATNKSLPITKTKQTEAVKPLPAVSGKLNPSPKYVDEGDESNEMMSEEGTKEPKVSNEESDSPKTISQATPLENKDLKGKSRPNSNNPNGADSGIKCHCVHFYLVVVCRCVKIVGEPTCLAPSG